MAQGSAASSSDQLPTMSSCCAAEEPDDPDMAMAESVALGIIDEEEEAAAEEMAEAQRITNPAEASAAVGALSGYECKLFLLEQAQNPAFAVLYEALTQHMIVQARNGFPEEPAPLSVSPETAAEMRQGAITTSAEKVRIALDSIDLAMQACGGLRPELETARIRLQEDTLPLALGAAEAQKAVHNALVNCTKPEAEKAIKKADRDVRDVVVLRCRAECEDPKDREGFLQKANEAYNDDLDKEVRAQLLLAYHKDPVNQQCGFVSNNQVAADRRGGPRPRRRRHSPGKKENRGEPEETPDTGGASSSSAAAEPMYVQSNVQPMPIVQPVTQKTQALNPDAPAWRPVQTSSSAYEYPAETSQQQNATRGKARGKGADEVWARSPGPVGTGLSQSNRGSLSSGGDSGSQPTQEDGGPRGLHSELDPEPDKPVGRDVDEKTGRVNPGPQPGRSQSQKDKHQDMTSQRASSSAGYEDQQAVSYGSQYGSSSSSYRNSGYLSNHSSSYEQYGYNSRTNSHSGYPQDRSREPGRSAGSSSSASAWSNNKPGSKSSGKKHYTV